MRITLALALPILLSFASGANAEPIEHIGVAAAVKDDVHATVDGVTKSLGAGNSLYQNEVVATDAKSMAQLLFLDQTSLSVGPKSEVKLDKFVYDPARKQGDVVLAATRGAFRFVTGAQDPKSYTLKTPVATIGVRGTIVDYGLENGRLIIRLVEGKATITLEDGKVVTLDSPGDAIVVLADGAVIGPAPWDGEIDTTISGTAFPLYSSKFSGTPHDEDTEKYKLNDHSQPNDLLVINDASSDSGSSNSGSGDSGSGDDTEDGDSGGHGHGHGHHLHHDNGNHFGHDNNHGHSHH